MNHKAQTEQTIDKTGQAGAKTKGAAFIRLSVRDIALCSLFAALTAAGTFVRVPFGYAPFTLQVFVTSLAGLMLGAKRGALSQLIYVALGLMGVPILASGGGPGYFLVPSCGFVLALPLSAAVIGLVYRPDTTTTVRRAILACVAGLAVLYAVGLSYMAFILGAVQHTPIPLNRLLTAAMLPYLPADAAKIAVCVWLTRRLPKL